MINQIDQELLKACVVNPWSVVPRMMLVDSMIENGWEEFKALEAFEPPTLTIYLPTIYGGGIGRGNSGIGNGIGNGGGSFSHNGRGNSGYGSGNDFGIGSGSGIYRGLGRGRSNTGYRKWTENDQPN